MHELGFHILEHTENDEQLKLYKLLSRLVNITLQLLPQKAKTIRYDHTAKCNQLIMGDKS